MIRNVLLFFFLTVFFFKALSQEYINNHERIYQTGSYEKAQQHNYLLEPLYPNYIEITGFVEAGDEMVVVRPYTILKPETTLTVFRFNALLVAAGGEVLNDDLGSRTSGREVRGVLRLANNGSVLTLQSTEDKIVGYAIYNANGIREINRTVSPPQQELEVGIDWLPVGLYYICVVFENDTYERARFQK